MRYTAIDLSGYPAPDAIVALDYEALLFERKVKFLTRLREARDRAEFEQFMSARRAPMAEDAPRDDRN